MAKNYRRQIVLFLLCALLLACNSDYIIKRRGYFKIDLPEKAYQSFNRPGYPYTFEYPLYGKIVKDTSFFDQHVEDDYWINIDFPRFNSRMHISYKEIGKKNQFDSLVNDAFTMSYKQHTYKASAIEPVPFTTPNGVEGIFFSLKGNTATANQFFVTDTTKHFLRGALYFDATPNEDSLSVVNRFLIDDVRHLINTFKWK